MVGAKKSNQEATIITDPVTKSEVNTVEEIKRVSLNYCSELLTNRSPKPGYEDILLWKSKMHELRMKEKKPEEEIEPFREEEREREKCLRAIRCLCLKV